MIQKDILLLEFLVFSAITVLEGSIQTNRQLGLTRTLLRFDDFHYSPTHNCFPSCVNGKCEIGNNCKCNNGWKGKTCADRVEYSIFASKNLSLGAKIGIGIGIFLFGCVGFLLKLTHGRTTSYRLFD